MFGVEGRDTAAVVSLAVCVMGWFLCLSGTWGTGLRRQLVAEFCNRITGEQIIFSWQGKKKWARLRKRWHIDCLVCAGVQRRRPLYICRRGAAVHATVGGGGGNWNAMLDWSPFLKPVLADPVNVIQKLMVSKVTLWQSQNQTEQGR